MQSRTAASSSSTSSSFRPKPALFGEVSDSGSTAGDDIAEPRIKRARHSRFSTAVLDIGASIRRTSSLRTSHTDRHSGAYGSAAAQSGQVEHLDRAAEGSLPLGGARSKDSTVVVAKLATTVAERPRPRAPLELNIAAAKENGTLSPPAPLSSTALPSPNTGFTHLQDVAARRIATLGYLRRASKPIWWFNTVRFDGPDLKRLPYFESRKLCRRASNFLILGLSIPAVLDFNSGTPTEYLKALNALFAEFETYQAAHNPEGPNSISRGRFPQMFKRATAAASAASLGRRSTSATEGAALEAQPSNTAVPPPFFTSPATLPTADPDLLPTESYTHLLTPALPFDPDFGETFATLCDVLIDVYTKILGLVHSPDLCTGTVFELFAKADAKVKKMVVQGIAKDFEAGSKETVRGEMAGLARLTLGGLM